MEEEQPEDNDGKRQAANTDRGDTLRFEVIMADIRDMLKQQRKLVELLFQNTEMKFKDPTSLNRKVKVKVSHLKHHCGGAQELETFRSSLRLNIRTHNHLVPGGNRDQVQYALDRLGSRANHPDHTLQNTTMTDSATWGHNLLADDHPCLHDLDQLLNEIL